MLSSCHDGHRGEQSPKERASYKHRPELILLVFGMGYTIEDYEDFLRRPLGLRHDLLAPVTQQKLQVRRKFLS